MKNSALILITFLLSTQISAQIKTGGGGPDVPATSKEIDSIDKHVNSFMAHLIENDAKCTTGDRLIKDKDLIQVYLKLSLFKNEKASSTQCDEVNRYLICLNDEASKKYAWQLERMIGVEDHITKKYNIPKEYSKKILKFFSDLGKKVE